MNNQCQGAKEVWQVSVLVRENTTPKHGEGSPCSSVKGLPRVPETQGLIHTAVETQA